MFVGYDATMSDYHHYLFKQLFEFIILAKSRKKTGGVFCRLKWYEFTASKRFQKVLSYSFSQLCVIEKLRQSALRICFLVPSKTCNPCTSSNGARVGQF